MSNLNLLIIDDGQIDNKVKLIKKENIVVNRIRMNEENNIINIMQEKRCEIIVKFVTKSNDGYKDILELNKYIDKKYKYKVVLILDFYEKEFINSVFYMGFFNIIDVSKRKRKLIKGFLNLRFST